MLHNVCIRFFEVPEYASASIAPHLNRMHRLKREEKVEIVRDRLSADTSHLNIDGHRPN